jgi:glycosyltransferase involved in cell wall biosynthesis
MKIALLTKYGNLAASTRQRFIQYEPFIKKVGIETEWRALLKDEYLQHLFSHGSRRPSYVLARYLNRVQWLLSAPDVDAIWLHCEVFPYLPGLIDSLVRLPGKPIIFDYDDAIFHNYDLHSNRFVRTILGRKLQNTIGRANTAFCGNAYLAAYARPLCPKVEIVPTVVDTLIYRPGSVRRPSAGVTKIGWIGTPSTWVEYMQDLLPMLTQLAKEGAARVAVMGADRKAESHPLIDFTDWSEDCEIPFLQNIDIGIMPLTDTPWARGKCGYKLIQYMACGLPVIASPVGVNKEIVEHGVNGYLVETDEEWRIAIKKLMSDADLRRSMGLAGRKKIENAYSLKVWGPRVAEMISQIVTKSKTK